ncbi:MAG: hypothetical protein ACM3VT_13835 [Solirubrobacterales bacterium]
MKATRCLILSIWGLLGIWAGPAAAVTTIDFESLPDDPFYSYSEGRVTFTAVDGGLLQKFADTPNGTFSLTGLNSPYSQLRADIAGGTRFVMVDLGDFANIDAETIFLEIYGPSGNLLDSISEEIPADRQGMTTLSLSAPCISYAIFGSRDSTLDNGSSVPADNFTFGDCPCIPAPATILLATIGAGLVSRLRLRGLL